MGLDEHISTVKLACRWNKNNSESNLKKGVGTYEIMKYNLKLESPFTQCFETRYSDLYFNTYTNG